MSTYDQQDQKVENQTNIAGNATFQNSSLKISRFTATLVTAGVIAIAVGIVGINYFLAGALNIFNSSTSTSIAIAAQTPTSTSIAITPQTPTLNEDTELQDAPIILSTQTPTPDRNLEVQQVRVSQSETHYRIEIDAKNEQENNDILITNVEISAQDGNASKCYSTNTRLDYKIA